MLELKKIKKSYRTGDFVQTALEDVSLTFRKNEFVSILGPSGSGKTTLLNIIGGLDRYDAGDLIINGKSTKKFKGKDWDAYRNNCVGFIFQSYNLIGHISVLDNIEMCMTLSGVGAKEKKQKAMAALERVGLKDHAHKKPNQLSGGQMQRVAIARALVNDPDIILADEPTGALDSKTSVQIMDLISEISKDKLVIMVTHNSDLAHEYANRIIEVKDGKVVEDSNPIKKNEKMEEEFYIKKTAMSFLTALKLSFNNIKTKKGRTILTAFASSIGIIGIALILSLSNGFDQQIDIFERDTLSNMPIFISEEAMQMDEEMMEQLKNEATGSNGSYTDKEEVYPLDINAEMKTHKNNISESYMKHINNIDQNLISGISKMRATNLNLISKKDGNYFPVSISNISIAIPEKNDKEHRFEVVETNFDLLKGRLPKEKNELLLIIDNQNRISIDTLKALGLDGKENVSFEDIMNVELKLVSNNEYYTAMGNYFRPNTNYKSLYESKNAETLKVVGIVRGKEEKKMLTSSSSGLTFMDELMTTFIEDNKDSAIVKKQVTADYNVLTGEVFEQNETGIETKDMLVSYLGGKDESMVIQVYPRDFDTKEKILTYLDEYNEGKEETDKVLYTDMGKMISSLSGNIMDAITIVLVAFSAISLVVSSIMIGIITYISVLERTKEIGILRALGARKKDVSRVFNAETFIIGVCSGLMGIAIARLLIIPVNHLLYELTELKNIAVLNPVHAIILITVSVLLTMIGGFIPAKVASKKDPVIALRTE